MLTQTEADALIAMKKTFVDTSLIQIPPGADQTHELVGEDKRELFLFAARTGKFDMNNSLRLT